MATKNNKNPNETTLHMNDSAWSLAKPQNGST